jgi:hypothetical protein
MYGSSIDVYRKVLEFVKNFYPGESKGNFARNLKGMLAMSNE